VLSTVRQAADLDYRLTVLEDACADGDPVVHRVLTEKVSRAKLWSPPPTSGSRPCEHRL